MTKCSAAEVLNAGGCANAFNRTLLEGSVESTAWGKNAGDCCSREKAFLRPFEGNPL